MNDKFDHDSLDVERIRRLVSDLRAWLDHNELSPDDRARLNGEIDALTEQLDTAAPTRELHPTLKRIAELARNAEDRMATSGIIEALAILGV